MDMSISYENTGRTRQKARTRSALVDAARAILAEGEHPVSNRRQTEPGSRARPPIATSQTGVRCWSRHIPSSMPRRCSGTHRRQIRWSGSSSSPNALPASSSHTNRSCEPSCECRSTPRPPTSDALPLRQGRAIGWIQDALEPLRERVPEHKLRNLTLAIRATLGIEALVWLTDIAGLSREDATALMRASARTLAESAIAESRDVPRQ